MARGPRSDKEGQSERGRRPALRRFGPVRYVLKDALRNMSRTMASLMSIASLTFLFIVFSSLQAGLDEHFKEDIGAPSMEDDQLYEIREVLESWTFLITSMCYIMTALVVANTTAMNVSERRVELASLRAVGLGNPQVFLLVCGSTASVLYPGMLIGLITGVSVVPLLDGAGLSVLSGGMPLPFSLSWAAVLRALALGTVSGAIGLAPPLLMISWSRPAEVLRNA